MKTLICLILDRSGSMAGRETDTVGGVNKFIDEQKKLPGEAMLAAVRFDSQGIERFRKLEVLGEVTPLELHEFVPRGGTPLLDAIGATITDLDQDWKAEKPSQCIVVIVTDGAENASRTYSHSDIKKMIEEREKTGKWAFIYLGANVDAFSEAQKIGVMMSKTAGYTNTVAGNSIMYAAASASVGEMRNSMSNDTTKLGKANLGETVEDWQSQVKKRDDTSWTPPETKE